MEDISRQPMLRVVVHLRRRDLLRGQWQMILRNRIWLLVFAACLATSIPSAMNSHPRPVLWMFIPAVVLTCLLLTAAGVVLVFLVVAPLMLRRLRNTPGVLGKHVFEIGEDGLRELTEVSEIRVAPGHAHRVLHTRNFLFVLVSRGSAFLLPRRDFSDSEAYRNFWNALQPLVAKKEKPSVA